MVDIKCISFKCYCLAKTRFQVLTAVGVKSAVFWVVAPCSPIEFRPTFQRYLLPPSSGSLVPLIEAASISETSVNFCQTTRCNEPEDSHIHLRKNYVIKNKNV
jgi:hypothetical protein